MTVEMKCKIELPSAVKAMVEEVQGVGKIDGITESYLNVTLEAENEYELGYMVHELEGSLYAATGDPIKIIIARPAALPSQP